MRLLTITEVSKQLNVSRERVYDLVRLDLIPSVHLGRQLRISEEALRDWVNSGGRALPGGWRMKLPQIESREIKSPPGALRKPADALRRPEREAHRVLDDGGDAEGQSGADPALASAKQNDLYRQLSDREH